MTPYTKQIVELHKIHKAIENCGCNKDEQGGGDSGSLLMSLIPNDFPKPDLFLYSKDNFVNPIDVTNYKVDDLINLLNEEEETEEETVIDIKCLYKNSNFSSHIINEIMVSFNDTINLSVLSIENHIKTDEVAYNNKTYYYYYEELI